MSSALPPTLFFSFLGLLFVLFVAGAARAQAGEAEHVLRSGRVGEAEIIGYLRSEDGITVKYTFLPKGHEEVLVCEKLVRGRVKQFPPGSRVPVRYLASYPSISVLLPYGRRQNPN